MVEENRKIRRREFFAAGGAMLLGGAANTAFSAVNYVSAVGNAP